MQLILFAKTLLLKEAKFWPPLYISVKLQNKMYSFSLLFHLKKQFLSPHYDWLLMETEFVTRLDNRVGLDLVWLRLCQRDRAKYFLLTHLCEVNKNFQNKKCSSSILIHLKSSFCRHIITNCCCKRELVTRLDNAGLDLVWVSVRVFLKLLTLQ